jgi:predicted HAD superfamily Cof-like phosphohydrolase
MSKENINRVKDFHDVSGLEYKTKPGIPADKKIDLRMALLEEELRELESAAYRGDIVEVLDALVDLQYILHGAVLDFGLQDVFSEAEKEVHRSNMSKFCEDTESAKRSVIKYQLNEVEAYYRLVNKRFVIRRSMDEKILKGENYSSPKIKKILEKYAEQKKKNG